MAKSSKKTGKNMLIILLVVLLLALAIAYASFSDTLTISGTANGKGTFDLEFQNAEVTNMEGVDEELTTATISQDGNTLNVVVKDMSSPGAGADFSVDIVNVGTIPAIVESVNPVGITGSTNIVIDGLDDIASEAPTLAAGESYTANFSVNWNSESSEVTVAEEAGIQFSLAIQYSQNTSNVFEGSASHTDTVSNIVDQGGQEQVQGVSLVENITGADYGKTINYSANVTNTSTNQTDALNTWKIFLNDGTNVYIILSDLLPVEYMPAESNLQKSTTTPYSISWGKSSGNSMKNYFLDQSKWAEFASGVDGAIATGTPTYEQLRDSWRANPATSSISINDDPYQQMTLESEEPLYRAPSGGSSSGCWSMYLATLSPSDDEKLIKLFWNNAGSVGISNKSVTEQNSRNPSTCKITS